MRQIAHGLVVASVLGISTVSPAVADTVLYQESFDGPATETFQRQYTGAKNPDGTWSYGSYTYLPASSDFDSSHLLMSQNARFRYAGGFDHNEAVNNIQVEFDLLSPRFTFFYDMPAIRRIDLYGGQVRMLNSATPDWDYEDIVGYEYDPDAVNRIRLNADLTNNWWTLHINDELVFLDVLNEVEPGTDDLRTLRFISDRSYTYIDNLTVTAVSASIVPLPGAVWLLGSAIGGLGWWRRRQTVA
jgi:hypothetical protein